jgi:CBS domain-containing protein
MVQFFFKGASEMLVKDVMEPVGQNWLHPEMNLPAAVTLMRKSRLAGDVNVNGMVVLDQGQKLVGVVSIKDIIRAVIPSYMENNLRGFAWDGMLEEHVKKARKIKVSDIMSKNVITIGPGDSLMRCADLMIDNYLQRLPVVDESGRVLGMVHIQALYVCIADLMSTLEE